MSAPAAPPAPARTPHEPQHGPHPGILAVVATGLFLAGLLVPLALSGGSAFPSPFGDTAASLAHFREHAAPTRTGGALHFAASVPLAIYAATVSARLHRLGIRAPGATIALAGGLLASAALAASGLLAWVLGQSDVVEHPGVVPALHLLAFATGGAGHVVPLGLLVAGIAVPGLLAGLLPRRLAWAGLVLAALAELSVFSLLAEALSPLLPVARFGGLAWLIAAGFLLPRTRPRTRRA
ncbi:hypothetical protein [Streptomyces sp. NPDC049879]|uniref:hypothetical protein n=1 Tax=Streptomyces sp. NPDC049879 TaxID=3365598 RepID=UPI0037BCDA76